VKLNAPVKKCKNCGEVFVVGYHASVGIQFWLTRLSWIGGSSIGPSVEGLRGVPTARARILM